MDLLRVDLRDKQQVQALLRLPFRLYQDQPRWVPPLAMDARLQLDPQRHPFYRHSEAAFFLVLREGSPVGRIAAIDNRRYNEYNGEQTAFFYLFECENEPAASNALFEAATTWARSRGLKRMVGPRGFTPLDGYGLLVRGFEHRPAFGMPYNPPYYEELIRAAGFEAYHDTVSGYLGTGIQFPGRIHELSARVQKRRGLRIATYKRRRDLLALLPHLKEMYNGALAGTAENVPLTDEEIKVMADQLLWFADPRLIKIVLNSQDKPVGFLLAYPDVSAALQKTGGKLFPFGWLALLWEYARTDWLNINGAGLLEEYRGSGGTAILFSEMFKTARQLKRYSHADVVQIGVENEAMQREMENFGIDFYKMHRVYKREL